jgi:hypothetical protein
VKQLAVFQSPEGVPQVLKEYAAFDGSPGTYLALPAVPGVVALSFWLWLDRTQDTAPEHYLLDARVIPSDPYMSSASKSNGWAAQYVDAAATAVGWVRLFHLNKLLFFKVAWSLESVYQH